MYEHLIQIYADMNKSNLSKRSVNLHHHPKDGSMLQSLYKANKTSTLLLTSVALKQVRIT